MLAGLHGKSLVLARDIYGIVDSYGKVDLLDFLLIVSEMVDGAVEHDLEAGGARNVLSALGLEVNWTYEGFVVRDPYSGREARVSRGAWYERRGR